MGIRARHAPLVARLVPNELRLWPTENESDVIRYAQGEGWLEVFANRARVLVAEAVAPGELDVAALRERLADAEARVKETEGEVDEPAARPAGTPPAGPPPTSRPSASGRAPRRSSRSPSARRARARRQAGSLSSSVHSWTSDC